jgi:hypothetical protein
MFGTQAGADAVTIENAIRFVLSNARGAEDFMFLLKVKVDHGEPMDPQIDFADKVHVYPLTLSPPRD